MSGIDWKNRIIEYGTKPADQFQANPRNWRKHPEHQRQAVRTSLDALGWIGVVIENQRTGHLLDGHERVMQALEDNADVPYILVDLDEEEEALALATFDPITQMATADRDMLSGLLAGLMESPIAKMGDVEVLLGQVMRDAGIDPVANLDDLEDEYGDHDETAFWPVIRVQVSPDTMELYESLMADAPGENEGDKLAALLGAVDATVLSPELS